jgi:hypothetical protein
LVTSCRVSTSDASDHYGGHSFGLLRSETSLLEPLGNAQSIKSHCRHGEAYSEKVMKQQ